MFTKGDPRINRKGRPLGPEKALARVLQVLEETQFHPVRELIKLYKDTPDDKLKKQILVILLEYMEGKKKATEDVDAPTTPDTSKQNAEAAHKLLDELESESQKPKV